MKSHRWPIVGLITVSLFGGLHLATCRADGPYHLLKEIAVPGEGGWDLLSIDEGARRLYVSHATQVVVIDLDKNQVVGEIIETPGVHDFAVAPKLRRGFSSNGKEDKASIVDLTTLKTLSKVSTGKNPDVILFEPSQQEVYSFNGHGNSATVFDPNTGKVIATIALPGKPELAAADPEAGRVYCNIEDANAVVAIDTKTHAIVNQWPIAPGEEASGMGIDLAHHRLFLGCHNKVMVLMDSTTGKVLATVPIDDGVDGTAFDPGTQFAFSSNGAGTVTVAHEDAPDKLTVVQILKTEPRARTMAVDLQTHNIYLPSAKFEASEGGARPKMIPGSMKILVYGK